MNPERECIIITGSSGFLGQALAHYFADKYEVIGLDQEGPPDPPPKTETLFCDLTSDESVQKTMFMLRSLYGTNIKAVFHLAAHYSFSGKPSHLYKDLTVGGTRRLLRELEKFNVGQFIFSSSIFVYKPGARHQTLAETAALQPTWDYPRSQVLTEEVIETNHGKTPAVILRIAGVYTNTCQSSLLAHQIQRIYENRLEGHLYSGDVDVKQTFVHLNDLISAFETCIKNADKLSDFEVFNIGEDGAMSYDDLQRAIARDLFDQPWPTFDVPQPIARAGAWVEDRLPLPEEHFVKPWMIDRANDNYEINSEKAHKMLNWHPQYSLHGTLPAILEGLKVNPEKWYELNKLHFPEGRQMKPVQPAGHNGAGIGRENSESFHPAPADQVLPPPISQHMDQ